MFFRVIGNTRFTTAAPKVISIKIKGNKNNQEPSRLNNAPGIPIPCPICGIIPIRIIEKRNNEIDGIADLTEASQLKNFDFGKMIFKRIKRLRIVTKTIALVGKPSLGNSDRGTNSSKKKASTHNPTDTIKPSKKPQGHSQRGFFLN